MRQVSLGSVLGLVVGVGLRAFSRVLVVLLGMGVVFVEVSSWFFFVSFFPSFLFFFFFFIFLVRLGLWLISLGNVCVVGCCEGL